MENLFLSKVRVMLFNFARIKVGLRRCFTDSRKTHKLSNYGCPSVAGRRNHIKNMYEFSVMIITKTQIKKKNLGDLPPPANYY